MSGFKSLLVKELQQLFHTPIPYVVIGIFWVLTGYFFSFNVFLVQSNHMVTTFHNMIFLLLLMVPLITMRIFSEERKSGTLEFLLTLPISDKVIVLAKFSAVWVLLSLLIVGTSSAVLPLSFFGRPDMGPILGGFLGVFLLGTTFVSVGLLTSVLSENQVTAAAGSWALLLAFWFIDYLVGVIDDPHWVDLIQHLSFSLHARDLIRGIVSSQAVVYFASLSALLVALTIFALRLRRL